MTAPVWLGLAAVALAAAADLWTTRRILAQPWGVERNPVLRWFLRRWGFAGLASAKLVFTAIGAGACFLLHPWLVLASAAPVFWVAWCNWRILRAMSGKGER